MDVEEVSAFLDACRTHRGSRPNAALQEATAALMRRAADQPDVMRRVAGALKTLPPDGAAWAALALGAAVEQGADPAVTAPSLMAFYESLLEQLPVRDADTVDDDEDDEADLPEPTPAQRALLSTLPWASPAVVTHLSRLPDYRAALRDNAPLLRRLEDAENYSHAASWVRAAIVRISGQLVCLHPATARGVRVRYSNVSSCFHLFSLIQTAIGERLPGGRAPDPTVAALARGQQEGRARDEAWWHYGDPRSPTADLGASVWGEAHVESIPVFDDVRVMLLWPPLLAMRGWESSFFEPHLDTMPADAVVEADLTTVEVGGWLDRLGVARR